MIRWGPISRIESVSRPPNQRRKYQRFGRVVLPWNQYVDVFLVALSGSSQSTGTNKFITTSATASVSVSLGERFATVTTSAVATSTASASTNSGELLNGRYRR